MKNLKFALGSNKILVQTVEEPDRMMGRKKVVIKMFVELKKDRAFNCFYRKHKQMMGQWFSFWLGSKDVFFRRGLTISHFIDSGKTPVESDKYTKVVIDGSRISTIFFMRKLGIGSRLQFLNGEDIIISLRAAVKIGLAFEKEEETS